MDPGLRVTLAGEEASELVFFEASQRAPPNAARRPWGVDREAAFRWIMFHIVPAGDDAASFVERATLRSDKPDATSQGSKRRLTRPTRDTYARSQALREGANLHHDGYPNRRMRDMSQGIMPTVARRTC